MATHRGGEGLRWQLHLHGAVGTEVGAAGAGTTHSLLDWTQEKAPRSSPWE